MTDLNIAFAGDRDISVWVLQYILDSGILPKALLIPDDTRSSHSNELRDLCDYLDDNHIFVGTTFRDSSTINFLKALQFDYIICIHFPYIVPPQVLDLPSFGVLNLHPAYLPYNRGWHTPSWALLEDTPIGATLHFMDEGIDTGDIVHQRLLVPAPSDTAHSLYNKVKKLELEIFKEVWNDIVNHTFQRIKQPGDAGTIHKRKELFKSSIQEVNMTLPQTPANLIRQLRALTTNDIGEAAYFDKNGKRYRIQVTIVEDQS